MEKICIRCNKLKKIQYKRHCKQCYKHYIRDQSPRIICSCGCGEEMYSIDLKGNKIYTKQGHHSKGSGNSRWIGGFISNGKGYYRAYKPHHIFQVNNYVYKHRIILEQYLSIKYNMPIYILPYFDIHHKNGVKDDNRPQNLEYLDKREHRQKHKAPINK